MAEEGHIQIHEFSREAMPIINMLLEDLFCQYGVSMPYFILEYDFPDYSERPEWATGYYYNLDWGPWGYYLPWFNELIGLLFDEAHLPRWQMPDFSPGSWDMFNSQTSQLYRNANRFGKTTIGATSLDVTKDKQFCCFYQTANAGSLQSISVHTKHLGTDAKMKCAMFSSVDGSLLGQTEEKLVTADQEGWMSFNFSATPSVVASTYYGLTLFCEENIRIKYDAGVSHQVYIENKSYNDWSDPLAPDSYKDWAISVYATYK